MKSMTATFLGFMVAPSVPVALSAILFPVVGDYDLIAVIGLNLLAYCVSLLYTLCLALPAFLVLSRFRYVNLWSCVIAGLVIGALGAVIFHIPSPVRAHDVMFMAPAGAAAAFVFWLIWRAGNKGSASTRSVH